jgi:hypothetical protein
VAKQKEVFQSKLDELLTENNSLKGQLEALKATSLKGNDIDTQTKDRATTTVVHPVVDNTTQVEDPATESMPTSTDGMSGSLRELLLKNNEQLLLLLMHNKHQKRSPAAE